MQVSMIAAAWRVSDQILLDKVVSNAIGISNQHHSGSVKHKSLLSSSSKLLL